MKKKIAIITMGVKLNNEPGYSRFKYLSDFLSDAGYKVDLITTSFQHWEKAQRDIKKIRKDKYKFRLRFIYEPGYKKMWIYVVLSVIRLRPRTLESCLKKLEIMT